MRYPSIVQSIGLMALVNLVAMFVGLPLVVWIAVQRGEFVFHPATIALGNSIAFYLICRFGYRRTGVALADVFPIRGVHWKTLAAVAVMTIGLDFLLSELDNVVRLFVKPSPEFIDLMRRMVGGETSLAWSLLLSAVVAPLTEESLFRGLILGGLLTRYRTGVAIAITAVLFGVMHMNIWQMASATCFGIMAGWVFVRTQSLVPCIWAHAVGNGMVTMLPRLPWEIQGFNTNPMGPHVFQPLWFDGLGLLLLIGGALAFRYDTRIPRSLDASS